MKKSEIKALIKEEFKNIQEIASLKTENGFELTDPELAVRWWGRKNNEEKQELLTKYLPGFKIDDMNHNSIFWLWKKQQKL
jgi:hypothetical protein